MESGLFGPLFFVQTHLFKPIPSQQGNMLNIAGTRGREGSQVGKNRDG